MCDRRNQKSSSGATFIFLCLWLAFGYFFSNVPRMAEAAEAAGFKSVAPTGHAWFSCWDFLYAEGFSVVALNGKRMDISICEGPLSGMAIRIEGASLGAPGPGK